MERRKILIATKTYPSISTKYRETVCTAGILLDNDETPLLWVRIYPVRFRHLDFDKRYPRWSILSAEIERNQKDNRLESYRINDNSIHVIRKIDTRNAWEERKQFLFPLQFDSVADLQQQGKSLGLIKPKRILRYYTEKTSRQWSQKQQAVLDQTDLFEPSVDLEKIPYKFGYQFVDGDDRQHKYSISDWEIQELYRKSKNQSRWESPEKREEEALAKVRQKLEVDFLANKDLYFIVGNLKNHQNAFMIIGLFYPPKVRAEQLKLF